MEDKKLEDEIPSDIYIKRMKFLNIAIKDYARKMWKKIKRRFYVKLYDYNLKAIVFVFKDFVNIEFNLRDADIRAINEDDLLDVDIPITKTNVNLFLKKVCANYALVRDCIKKKKKIKTSQLFKKTNVYEDTLHIRVVFTNNPKNYVNSITRVEKDYPIVEAYLSMFDIIDYKKSINLRGNGIKGVYQFYPCQVNGLLTSRIATRDVLAVIQSNNRFTEEIIGYMYDGSIVDGGFIVINNQYFYPSAYQLMIQDQIEDYNLDNQAKAMMFLEKINDMGSRGLCWFNACIIDFLRDNQQLLQTLDRIRVPDYLDNTGEVDFIWRLTNIHDPVLQEDIRKALIGYNMVIEEFKNYFKRDDPYIKNILDQFSFYSMVDIPGVTDSNDNIMVKTADLIILINNCMLDLILNGKISENQQVIMQCMVEGVVKVIGIRYRGSSFKDISYAFPIVYSLLQKHLPIYLATPEAVRDLVNGGYETLPVPPVVKQGEWLRDRRSGTNVPVVTTIRYALVPKFFWDGVQALGLGNINFGERIHYYSLIGGHIYRFL